MKRFLTILAIISVVSLAVLLILPIFARGKGYSGPGIAGNLHSIQMEKEVWLANGHTNEWPTVDDLFPGRPRGRSLNETFRRKYDELYFINRTGAPPFAYIPKAGGPYRGGELLLHTSNGLTRLRQ